MVLGDCPWYYYTFNVRGDKNASFTTCECHRDVNKGFLLVEIRRYCGENGGVKSVHENDDEKRL